MRASACLLAMVLAPQFAIVSAAQNPIEEARRHYDAAAYEDALSTLARADRSSPSRIIEVEQYRALCLIALGKTSDAEDAVEAIINADPLYVPDAPPRVEAFVSEVRRNALPGVARRLLDDGRTAYTGKEFDRARDSFQLLLRVLADPAMQGRSETADLRVLADGFVALLSAAPPPPRVAEARPSPVAEAPAPAPPPAPPVLVAPVVVREVMPPWVPDQITGRYEYTGTLKVTIGVDGRVKGVEIDDPSHPAYDARLLQEARSWVYKPATRDGQPIEFERTITVRLRPAQ